ncbi:hypothetical protein Rxycam_02396 [Rubrobacter xylanophilus DSM 9941]|uniref:hypothetical protein n=1 Tax=Rubrobacter xylanophilus TaxID=49319 RepID=UPI001C642C79|nr:hypothetical protein [Rubrobacter xylanophilus]QYJ16563.1 hypothetical protein Rxycam_02396 [Rubrobacter xylanophilus DSM 9941]
MRGLALTVLVVVVCAAILLSGCSREEGARGASAGETTAAPVRWSTALAGVEEASEEARRWREDALLYAVATPEPALDARGRSPAWLYTFVSPSAGAVASVEVRGGEARRLPEQPLPESDIQNLRRNALPPPERLLDSDEALRRTREVRGLLSGTGGRTASAGLDSLSGGGPVWIFATVGEGRRLEERVPAVSGG